jgi:hypothetical protein
MQALRRINLIALIAIVITVCGHAQTPTQEQKPAVPTMKKVEKTEAPPARLRKRYDRAHDATYVNVDIPLLSRNAEKIMNGATASPVRELALTFQLVYKGATTADLKAAYLIVESTAAPEQGARLNAIKEIEINADDYHYNYERVDYKTEQVEISPTRPVEQRESVVFKLVTDDLPQLANANSLKLKFGTEQYTVKSPQLSELRSTLVNGAD